MRFSVFLKSYDKKLKKLNLDRDKKVLTFKQSDLKLVLKLILILTNFKLKIL